MNLKLARIQSGKTQLEIANIIGSTQNTYSNYETEKTEPAIKTLIALADYYGVSLDYLCGRQYNNQVGYIPDNRKELVKLMLSLSDNDATKLFGYAKALKDENS